MNILDGIKSLALKLGSKQEQTHYARDLSLTDDLMQIEALWRDNWIANKVCIKGLKNSLTRKNFTCHCSRMRHT